MEVWKNHTVDSQSWKYVSSCGHVTYVWWGLALPQLAVGLPVSLLVSMTTRVSLDEGDVVIVGASRSGQDPHEVAVVAEVLQQTGHPPKNTHTQKHTGLLLNQ